MLLNICVDAFFNLSSIILVSDEEFNILDLAVLVSMQKIGEFRTNLPSKI